MLDPFGDQAVVQFVTFWAAVFSKVEVSSIQPDNGEILGFVVAVFWNRVLMSRHVRILSVCGNVVPVLRYSGLSGRTANRWQVPFLQGSAGLRSKYPLPDSNW